MTLSCCSRYLRSASSVSLRCRSRSFSASCDTFTPNSDDRFGCGSDVDDDDDVGSGARESLLEVNEGCFCSADDDGCLCTDDDDVDDGEGGSWCELLLRRRSLSGSSRASFSRNSCSARRRASSRSFLTRRKKSVMNVVMCVFFKKHGRFLSPLIIIEK